MQGDFENLRKQILGQMEITWKKNEFNFELRISKSWYI